MWKIVKFVIVPVLIAAVLITGIATVALADDGQAAQKGQWGQKFLARVAQILNIDQQKLTDAVRQARTELRGEVLDNRIDKWLADGKLTQDQANQVRAWLDARPAVPMAGAKAMEKLLKDGKITQAQYDAYKAWLDQRPKIDWPKPQKPGNAPLKGMKNNSQNIN